MFFDLTCLYIQILLFYEQKPQESHKALFKLTENKIKEKCDRI